jgi:hypothetical protein
MESVERQRTWQRQENLDDQAEIILSSERPTSHDQGYK